MGERGSTSHKDGGATRVARDEEAVERIVQTITNWVDPFKQDEVITHISSGKHDSPSIEEGLLSVGQVWLKAVHNFVTERLSTDGETPFYDPLPKHPLKTTTLFSHLFGVGQDTQVARNVLLSYELNSIPR